MVKKKKKKVGAELKSMDIKSLKKHLEQKVTVKKILKKPKQVTIVIKKPEVRETPRSLFFKQEQIGAQNVLFGE